MFFRFVDIGSRNCELRYFFWRTEVRRCCIYEVKGVPIDRSFLFRSPPLEVLNLVLKNCLSFEATHSTEPCYVWNWEVKRKKDRCPIPVKDMLFGFNFIYYVESAHLWLAQHDPRDLHQLICITKSANKTQWKSEFTYLWKTYNQSRSPLCNVILFSCSMYFHLLKIAIYLWWRSIRGTTKFQFAFSS